MARKLACCVDLNYCTVNNAALFYVLKVSRVHRRAYINDTHKCCVPFTERKSSRDKRQETQINLQPLKGL